MTGKTPAANRRQTGSEFAFICDELVRFCCKRDSYSAVGEQTGSIGADALSSKSPSTRRLTAPLVSSSTIAGTSSALASPRSTFPVCGQYTLQGDAFSKAVLENTEVSISIEDAIKNMAVIEAIFQSANSGQRISPQRWKGDLVGKLVVKNDIYKWTMNLQPALAIVNEA
jgi:hypothetical protein